MKLSLVRGIKLSAVVSGELIKFTGGRNNFKTVQYSVKKTHENYLRFKALYSALDSIMTTKTLNTSEKGSRLNKIRSNFFTLMKDEFI